MFSGEFRYTSNLDLSYLKENFFSYYKKLDKMNEKDLIILFGSNKSGKSTFANYMAGCQMDHKEKFGDKVIVPKSKSSEYVKIGHGVFSETTYPQSIATEHGFEYCDSPSFDANRLVDAKIGGSILTQLAIHKANTIKGVVFFIPYHCFDNIETFYHNINAMNYLFKNVLKTEQSVMIMITKAPQKIALNEVIDKFKYYAEMEEKNTIHKPIAQSIYTLVQKNPHLIHLFKPLDEKNRNVIVQKIKELKPLAKEQLTFPLCDADHVKFKEIIIEIANNSLKLFEHRNHLLEILSTNFSVQYNARYEHQLHEIEEDILSSLLEETSDMQFAYKIAQFITFDSPVLTQFVDLYKKFQDDFEKIKLLSVKKNQVTDLVGNSMPSLFSQDHQSSYENKSIKEGKFSRR